eukprot:7073531-Alexandrium_andersonii.AAC.1
MSASLVGSEMCIRDRPTAGQAETRACCFEKGCGGTSSKPTSIGKTPLLPVSYTHLTLPTICSV